MTVPGSNLLKMAGSVIGFQKFTLYQWTGKTITDDAGRDKPVFSTPIPNVKGSIQPVSRSMYETFGLDFQKNYIMVYSSVALRDLKRDETPDELEFNRRRYMVESNTDWLFQDCWRGSLCIDTGPAS